MRREGNVENAILAQLALPKSELLERVKKHNQIILHNYRCARKQSCECFLVGCMRSFEITLIPSQVLYPKFCEEHRSEFRREQFVRMLLQSPGAVQTEAVVAELPSPEKEA